MHPALIAINTRRSQHSAQLALTAANWVVLNVAFAGPVGDHVCLLTATVAQERCLDSLAARCRDLMAEVPRGVLGGGERIRCLSGKAALR